jgi:hypothetical protein
VSNNSFSTLGVDTFKVPWGVILAYLFWLFVKMNG